MLSWKANGLICRGVAVLILFLSMVSQVSADTNVSGLISSNTTWTQSASPYIVTGNILVNGGVNLTIQPGVTVKFQNGRSLQIDGTLVARGTGTNKITFTSNNPTPTAGDWGYIIFSDSSTDATYDVNGGYVSGSIMEHVVVEYAGGVSVDNNGALRLNNAHPFINYATISNNAASGICAWDVTGNVKVMNTTVTNNAAFGRAAEISIFGKSGFWTVDGSATIIESKISNYHAESAGGSGIYATLNNVKISNNEASKNAVISGNGGGMYVSGVYAEIHSNFVYDNSTDALYPGCGLGSGEDLRDQYEVHDGKDHTLIEVILGS